MSDLEETPPYTWNPLARFCDRAPNYAKYRPSYPAAAIDVILEGMETQSPIIAADVGAGTGISSRLLAERGVRVLAIEPNADMRQAAAPHPLVEFREATAEATALSDASVDLVSPVLFAQRARRGRGDQVKYLILLKHSLNSSSLTQGIAAKI